MIELLANGIHSEDVLILMRAVFVNLDAGCYIGIGCDEELPRNSQTLNLKTDAKKNRLFQKLKSDSARK